MSRTESFVPFWRSCGHRKAREPFPRLHVIETRLVQTASSACTLVNQRDLCRISAFPFNFFAMATRRTTIIPRGTRSNSRVNPSSTASSSRTQSAQANSHSSHRAESNHLLEERADGPQAHKTSRTNGQKEDAETNIRVIIRCRRRSEREVQENSPIIVTANGRKSQDITIETAAPVTSLGVVTLPPTRTYPFDLVFGPEADQSDIYHDVVSPMLAEVMQGYNCTLFAYGQTGTGKTCVAYCSWKC